MNFIFKFNYINKIELIKILEKRVKKLGLQVTVHDTLSTLWTKLVCGWYLREHHAEFSFIFDYFAAVFWASNQHERGILEDLKTHGSHPSFTLGSSVLEFID